MRLSLLATTVLAAPVILTGCMRGETPPPAAVAAQTATVSQAAVGPVAPATTAPRPQIGNYGFDEAGMDKGIAPGDDFYGFANGTWAQSTPIPADKSNFGMFSVLDDL